MSYSCFPNQTPFVLPPNVVTAPEAPAAVDNGPQTPPNSVDISFWLFAVIGEPQASIDWNEALISVDSSPTDWDFLSLTSESNPLERDLCELLNLLDVLPDDEAFIAELEEPGTPILPPFIETYYADLVVRPAVGWFFVPGAIVVDGGSASAVVRPFALGGEKLNAIVRSSSTLTETGRFNRRVTRVRIVDQLEPAIVGRIRLRLDAEQETSTGLGVSFGLTVTASHSGLDTGGSSGGGETGGESNSTFTSSQGVIFGLTLA